jgi:hypothetical protein
MGEVVTNAAGDAIGLAKRLDDGVDVVAVLFTDTPWDRPDRRIGVFRKRRLAERAIREAADG